MVAIHPRAVAGDYGICSFKSRQPRNLSQGKWRDNIEFAATTLLFKQLLTPLWGSNSPNATNSMSYQTVEEGEMGRGGKVHFPWPLSIDTTLSMWVAKGADQ